MLTISEICDQYAYLYTKNPVPESAWDHVFPVDGAYVAVKRVGNTDYVMFRGSVTFLDWIEDFQNFAVPYDDPILGPVHPGARLGVLAVLNKINSVIYSDSRVVVVGHSLGALHAAIFAGYRIASGKSVDSLVMFGEPKAGGPKLSTLIKNHALVYSYKNQDENGHDLVTDVPFSLPSFAPYQHISEPLILVTNPPLEGDVWLAFRYHHFALYARALGSSSTQVLSLPLKG